MSHPRIFRNKGELIRNTVTSTDVVLDVGFLGQGIQNDSDHWPHALIKKVAADVFGVDLEIDRATYPDAGHYHEESAEQFAFPGRSFNAIFAGDLIEHLPNPGQFLAACRAHMTQESRLILTTPNAFNLFNIAEKFTKDEPTVNADHTAYFNRKTLKVLLEKCGLELSEVGYVYSLEYDYTESWKKKILNALYALFAHFTPKYLETLVVIAALPRTQPSYE